MSFTDEIRDEYLDLFASCVPSPERSGEIDRTIATIIRGKARYAAVSAATGVPWFYIGIVHLRECSSRFDRHIHNGDPIGKPTVKVPANRPPNWPPDPFPADAWEQSAIDSMRYQGLHKWGDWSVPGLLYRFESYNGFGYRMHRHIRSPYLWGASNHQEKGKYIADRVWSPDVMDQQLGCATILRRMVDRNLIEI